MEGECYLFDCGTPDDFPCVFDHHARFMSVPLKKSAWCSNKHVKSSGSLQSNR